MALRKCPYCKAIIDESLQYCSNCGTQLLFPEDEEIEEDIPGERIVEEEEEEEGVEHKYEVEESGLASDEEEEEVKESLEEVEPEEVLPEEKEEEIEEREKEPSEELPEKGAEELEETKEKAKDMPPSGSLKFDTADLEQVPDARTKDLDEMQRILKSFKEKAESAERPRFDEDHTPPLEEKEEAEDLAQAEEEIPEKAEAAFLEGDEKEEMDEKTEEEEISEDERKEREDIEEFLDSIKKERADQALAFEKSILSTTPEEKDVEREPTPHVLIDLEEKEKEDIERFVKEVKEERKEETTDSITPEEFPATPKGIKIETSELKRDIPPWAEKIKEAQPPESDEIEEKATEEETPAPEEEIPEEAMAEEVFQEEELPKEESSVEVISEEPTIPDMDVSFPEIIEEEEIFKEGAEELAEEEAKKETPEIRMREVMQPPSKLSIWLISRAFDLLTTGACWFITLWIASRLVGVSLFQLISVSTLPAIGFYLIILFIYCFFFLLFLGETLGHYIFSQE